MRPNLFSASQLGLQAVVAENKVERLNENHVDSSMPMGVELGRS